MILPQELLDHIILRFDVPPPSRGVLTAADISTYQNYVAACQIGYSLSISSSIINCWLPAHLRYCCSHFNLVKCFLRFYITCMIALFHDQGFEPLGILAVTLHRRLCSWHLIAISTSRVLGKEGWSNTTRLDCQKSRYLIPRKGIMSIDPICIYFHSIHFNPDSCYSLSSIN